MASTSKLPGCVESLVVWSEVEARKPSWQDMGRNCITQDVSINRDKNIHITFTTAQAKKTFNVRYKFAEREMDLLDMVSDVLIKNTGGETVREGKTQWSIQTN